MFKGLIDWYLAALKTGGYPLIALLMAIESSIVPLPSEVIIPPAAHLAHSTHQFSVTGIVIAGAIGSWLGATAMYWAARLGGRPLLLRWGPYARITSDKIEGAERWAVTRSGASPTWLDAMRSSVAARVWDCCWESN